MYEYTNKSEKVPTIFSIVNINHWIIEICTFFYISVTLFLPIFELLLQNILPLNHWIIEILLTLQYNTKLYKNCMNVQINPKKVPIDAIFP